MKTKHLRIDYCGLFLLSCTYVRLLYCEVITCLRCETVTMRLSLLVKVKADLLIILLYLPSFMLLRLRSSE